jgi:hypothetical protein
MRISASACCRRVKPNRLTAPYSVTTQAAAPWTKIRIPLVTRRTASRGATARDSHCDMPQGYGGGPADSSALIQTMICTLPVVAALASGLIDADALTSSSADPDPLRLFLVGTNQPQAWLAPSALPHSLQRGDGGPGHSRTPVGDPDVQACDHCSIGTRCARRAWKRRLEERHPRTFPNAVQATAVAAASLTSLRTFPVSLTVSTGHGAARITRSATLPISRW